MPITDSGKIPNVNIIFKGFFISRINDGNPTAEVGALSESECHRPRICIFKSADQAGFPPTVEGVVFDINENIEFKVENTELTKIKEFRKEGPFNRMSENENDPDDFRWVVDLNAEIFGGQAFPVIPSKLRPIFRLNNAEFYTLLKTNPLSLKRPGQNPQPFGKIAEHFAANIYFTSDQSRLVIKNGSKELLTIDNTKPNTYQILIDCHCQQDLSISDFPQVFEVFANVPDANRADFVPANPPPPEPGALTGGPIQGGDVPCGGGNIKP